jgi:hypothetical protein
MSEPLKLHPGDRLWGGKHNQGAVNDVAPEGDDLDVRLQRKGRPSNLYDRRLKKVTPSGTPALKAG